MRVKAEQNRNSLHKALFLELLALTFVLTVVGFAVSTAHADSASQKPVVVKIENVARGKDVSFRSFHDFSEVPIYDYYYDHGGINGTGCREFVDNHITDGALTFMNSNMGTSEHTNPNLAWLYIDLLKTEIITHVQLNVVGTWSTNKVVIEVSADGQNWTTVYSTAVLPVTDENGAVGYSGGLLNTECLPDNMYVDYSSHYVLGCMSLVPSTSGYSIEIEPIAARHVRLTNLLSEHTNGGSSNNTVFTEIEVYAATQGVVSPSASVRSGAYENIDDVSLSAPYADAKIYYTRDGSYPDSNSMLYTVPIDVSNGGALRAVTVLNDGQFSYPSDYVYDVEIPANLALGKTITYRSYDDMNTVLDMYNYYPDASGDIDGGYSVYTFTGNTLTDGNDTWWGVSTSTSTGAGVCGWAYLDLGHQYEIASVNAAFVGTWAFENVVVQISNDAQFNSGVTTLFANTLVPLTDSNNNIIYDGTFVGHAGQDVSANGQYLYSGDKMHVFSAPEGTVARYIRLTNISRRSTNGATAADDNTVFCEIQVSYGGEQAGGNATELERTVNEIDVQTHNVRYGAALSNVIDGLPDEISVKDEIGVSHDVSVSGWSCTSYNALVAGEYAFTADITTQGKLINIYNVYASITVKVREKADFSAINELIEKTASQTQSGSDGAYTLRSWSVFDTARTEAVSIAANISALQSELNETHAALSAAYRALEFLADKTSLNGAITTAGELELSLYTRSSKEGFSSAVDVAVVVSEDADASQKEAESAYKTLSEILSGLKLIGNTSELQQIYDRIIQNDYDMDLYVTSARAALEDAMFCAKELIDKKDVSPDDVAADDILAAGRGLTAAEQAMPAGLLADTTAIRAALVIAAGLPSAEYTSASYAALEKVIRQIRLKFDAPGADLAVADGQAMLAELEGAVSALIERTDVSVLENKLAEALVLLPESYTSDSYVALDYFIKQAQAAILSEAATAENIALLVQQLDDAIGQLVTRGVKTTLSAAIITAGSVVTALYTPRSVSSFNAVLDAVKEVEADGNAEQSMIDAALSALLSAQSNLVLRADKSELKKLIDESSEKAKNNAGLKKSLNVATAVFEDDNSSQEDVKAAGEMLKVSLDGFAKKKTTALIVFFIGLAAAIGAGAVWGIRFMRRRRTNREEKNNG